MNDYASIVPQDAPLRPGVLLVAHPAMDDLNFERAVVVVLAHDDESGTVGVIINDPAPPSRPLDTVISDWLTTSPEPRVVFRGGPVRQDGFICLVEHHGSSSGVATLDFLGEAPLPGRRHRMFRGHAGWAPGQLRAEIAEGIWIVADSTPDDTFSVDPSRLWTEILERQGDPWSRLAHMPRRPDLN